MKKINSNPTHRAKLSRSGHDVSQTVKFTSACGQLLPVYWDVALPGDHYRFSSEMFTRTKPLVRPALLQARQRVEWFFVPTNLIYQFFEDLQFNIFDSNTDFVILNTSKVAIPKFKIEHLSAAFNALYTLADNTQLTNNSTTSQITGSMRDIFGVPMIYNVDRLIGLLRYGGYTSPLIHLGSQTDQQFSDVALNIIAIASYQKIYQDIYRLTNREAVNPSSYNFDSCFGQDVPQNRLVNLFTLHYRPWELDYFTNNFPSPIFDYVDNNYNSIDEPFPNGDGQNSYDYFGVRLTKYLETRPWYNSNIQITQSNKISPLDGNQKSQNGSFVTQELWPNVNNPVALRSMLAHHKRMEISRRAAKHADAQILAHYGVDIPNGMVNHVIRIGSEESSIQISDVTSTAETEDGALGSLAGKGIGYGQNKLKNFKAPCHGVIMAISSIVPECDYVGFGIDKHHTHLTPEDFYQPEYDRIGMQPLYAFECRFTQYQESQADPFNILGFQYRYSEYKQKYNFATGGFAFGGDVSHYSAFRDFVFESSQATLATPSSLYPYYISPNYLDNIFEVSFTFNSNTEKITSRNAYARDPFINMIHFNVYKTSVMSVFGLPQL